MADASAVHDALHGIAGRMDGDMSEKDVENASVDLAVYDLFELTEEERQVSEEYLEMF